jgi:hypothetical protein
VSLGEKKRTIKANESRRTRAAHVCVRCAAILTLGTETHLHILPELLDSRERGIQLTRDFIQTITRVHVNHGFLRHGKIFTAFVNVKRARFAHEILEVCAVLGIDFTVGIRLNNFEARVRDFLRRANNCRIFAVIVGFFLLRR